MEYLEIKIAASQDCHDILVAELGAIGYDSFQEMEDELIAYVEKTLFSEDALDEIISKYEIPSYIIKELENKNWNEEWEKNFEPVVIGGKCLVRASFHDPRPDLPFEVIINPKMSFGTGHHETTALMLEFQLETNHKGKKVLDAGSGTGILAVMASKLGAASVLAYDIEDWAFENIKENINLNTCSNIEVKQGTILSLGLNEKFDLVLANINKNVLMEEIPLYEALLNKGGELFLSGFYKQDMEDINSVCSIASLVMHSHKESNNWVAVRYVKQ